MPIGRTFPLLDACPLSILFRQLPIEIQQLIFKLACTSFDYKIPLSLSAVCFQWREIALATPVVWSHIYAGPGTSEDVVRLFLERAGNSPLAIRIEHRQVSKRSPSPNVEPQILDALLEVFARWSLAELCITEGDVQRLKKIMHGAQMPLLQDLWLETNSHYCSQRIDFSGAPNLRAISVDASDDLSAWNIPWSQINDLVVRQPTRSNPRDGYGHIHAHSLPTTSAQTQRLVLDGPVSNIAWTFSTSFQFTSLVLAPGIWSLEIWSLLESVTLPSLVDLTVVTGRRASTLSFGVLPDPSWCTKALISFIKRSRCVIRDFAIYDDAEQDYGVWHIVPLLDGVPSLRTLSVSERSSTILTPDLWERLGSPSFLPNLDVLELSSPHDPRCCASSGIEEPWLSAVEACRARAYIGLERLILNGSTISLDAY